MTEFKRKIRLLFTGPVGPIGQTGFQGPAGPNGKCECADRVAALEAKIAKLEAEQ